MSAPATEDLRELERLLLVAAEQGAAMSRIEVQERFAVGASEADGMLSALREHGKAVEVAPGEWSGPAMDELAHAEPERVVVDVQDEEQWSSNGARMVRRPAPELGATGERVALVSGEPTVRLTMAIAEALDAEAIGKIVKAAIEGVEDGEIFVLEVTP